ncbi:MAG: branched-chain amino acid transport system II carrier protein [Clostridiales bacterium]|nr:branched-chain amino acid transport system II carrier protein [Clostridiales bacterium]MBS5878325.1 branched-chain amino acid transport system II carrier protein [Clostridiales bacterium]MDU0939691.1 branched-chain amino acid transport system II carrier protein [Clostridiales bacterium]MDU1042623.1 branched-chain amino acid transport system II carrier protein [Clostridiales bacterium]
MKSKLTWGETVSVASLLFGLFFGAGNLIFPAFMGQAAGRNMLPALTGFLVTGVGLPLMGVISLGITRTSGLQELSSRNGKSYGYFFTCALYLTIGPFFAIPRCFTVPFETGIVPLLPKSFSPKLALFIFSLIFFAIMLFFSLKPGKILDWIGKFLTPAFLAVFGWIMITALIRPAGGIASAEPVGDYAINPFVKGLLEGYNTMDALAGLAFGIIIVNVIRSLGVTIPGDIAKSTIRSGILTAVIMSVIYAITTVVGVQSLGIIPHANNGGEVLSAVARHYYHGIGGYLLAIMIFFACLKTTIGLVTSCGETFEKMFPGKLSYKKWAIIFSLISLAIANVGLSGIIKLSIPVLMMLYPLAMTLILLALTEKLFRKDQTTYRIVTFVTLICAVGDLVANLPQEAVSFLHIGFIPEFFARILPLYKIGLGWMLPAGAAFCVALVIYRIKES